LTVNQATNATESVDGNFNCTHNYKFKMLSILRGKSTRCEAKSGEYFNY
jgi:hypothetical protein